LEPIPFQGRLRRDVIWLLPHLPGNLSEIQQVS